MISNLLESCRAKYGKNAICLSPASETDAVRTHLGGTPLLPADFNYPTFTGEGTDGVKNRPLSFLAQIDCAEIHALDCDALLPDHGILSFFYEQDSQCWGREPADAGCARAYWFGDADALRETPLPDALAAEYRVPHIPVSLSQTRELPDYNELSESADIPELEDTVREDSAFDAYCKARSAIDSPARIKLLGYADIIQSDMKSCCLKCSDPQYRAIDWGSVTDAFRAEYHAEKAEWILLFQMDSLNWQGDSLCFADDGRLYFYIRKSDLAKRDFSRIWMVLQCY